MSHRIDLTKFRLCVHPYCLKGSQRKGFVACPKHKRWAIGYGFLSMRPPLNGGRAANDNKESPNALLHR